MRILARAVFAVAVATPLVTVGCMGDEKRSSLSRDRAVPGDALEPVNAMAFRMEDPFGPGQTFSIMHVPAVNRSESPVTLRRIEPLTATGAARVARVVSIDLAPREDGETSYLPLAVYQTHPPRMETEAGCLRERLVPVDGYLLPPASGPLPAALLVLRVRALAPGRFRMRGQRVFYEQAGDLYYQDFPYEITVTVRAGAKRRPFEEERRCAGAP